ncbi:uncharacterized protein LOC124621860 [Schistocerca americana]|uniref:uncharacterized protein LOC124621860 n=1 Tax=Schistocerca americana TaxID=7009 RepID=UPI001F4FC183|nr:uncharacterized protein LOC124621860 [Schistocerca americana]XP_047003275.1 uncharacterized protein LOC124621860 [Schistocerca americana]
MLRGYIVLNTPQKAGNNKEIKKFFFGLKRKGKKKYLSEYVPDVNVPVEPPDSPTPDVPELKAPELLTWPHEKLEMFLKEILLEKSKSLNSVPVDLLPRYINEAVNETHPFSIPEQYDYCVVCVHDDYDEAASLKKELYDKHKLVGHVIWDSAGLGMDQFFAFEDCKLRSTKILFYVSEKFISDEFCCHLVRDTVLCPKSIGEMKAVPVLKTNNVKMPESLELVDRLTLDNIKQFDFRLPCIFTTLVRQEKMKRTYAQQMEIDTIRQRYVIDFIEDRLKACE